MSIATDVNLLLTKGEKNVTLTAQNGTGFEQKAFVCVYEKQGVTIDFCGADVESEACYIDLKNSSDITIKNLRLKTSADFAIRINACSNVKMENVSVKAGSVCLFCERSSVELYKCDFCSGNGACVTGESEASFKVCNFTSPVCEGITVLDNALGIVRAEECAFKKSSVAIKSAGRNQIRVINNYFLCSRAAMEIVPSLFKDKFGASHVEFAFNMVDEVGECAIVVEGVKKARVHGVVDIHDNIFLGKSAPVIKADGVESLSFKNNKVTTNHESEVTNSVINGINA